MNLSRVVVEDCVLALADELRLDNRVLAARLRDAVPGGDGRSDEHVAHMRSIIENIGSATPRSVGRRDRRSQL